MFSTTVVLNPCQARNDSGSLTPSFTGLVTAMATAHMPDESFDAVAHHLPPEQPVGPKGGRPRVGHRTALRVIWFVLTAGTRWEDVPEELGGSGRTAHRRLRAR